jgi:hypothetical protein
MATGLVHGVGRARRQPTRRRPLLGVRDHGKLCLPWLGEGVGQAADEETDELTGLHGRKMEGLDAPVTPPQAQVHKAASKVPCRSQADAPFVHCEMSLGSDDLFTGACLHVSSVAPHPFGCYRTGHSSALGWP